jgi:hypothetical protein
MIRAGRYVRLFFFAPQKMQFLTSQISPYFNGLFLENVEN